jgi:hypothetical protein
MQANKTKQTLFEYHYIPNTWIAHNVVWLLYLFLDTITSIKGR